MHILEAIHHSFWAIMGGLVCLALLSAAVMSVVQGKKRDAVFMALMAFAFALIGVSQFRKTGEGESWPNIVIGLSGVALLVFIPWYWRKSEPDPPSAENAGSATQTVRHLRQPPKKGRNKRRHKSA